MSSYKKSQWKRFRQGIIELDGYKCRQCGRGEGEVILQVHHKRYKSGYKAWEYSIDDCITLCRGCHSQEHGKTQPKYGWECIGEEDLGSLDGTCENSGCSSNMRYSFTVFHPMWGTLEVGAVCCDFLTDTVIASNFRESRLKFESRKHRFVDTKRWSTNGNRHHIIQGLFEIEIFELDNKFTLKVNGIKSNTKHETLESAKSIVFDKLEDGTLMNFFKKRNPYFDKQHKGRSKPK